MTSNICNINIPSLEIDGTAFGYVIGNVKGSINSFCINGDVDGNGDYKGLVKGYVNGVVSGHIKGYASVNGAQYGFVDMHVNNATVSCFSLMS